MFPVSLRRPYYIILFYARMYIYVFRYMCVGTSTIIIPSPLFNSHSYHPSIMDFVFSTGYTVICVHVQLSTTIPPNIQTTLTLILIDNNID